MTANSRKRLGACRCRATAAARRRSGAPKHGSVGAARSLSILLPNQYDTFLAMEVFNPNPTIFVPTRSSKASHFAKPHSLWLDDDDSDREREEDDESNEIEAIDQDEIFGAHTARRCRIHQTR